MVVFVTLFCALFLHQTHISFELISVASLHAKGGGEGCVRNLFSLFLLATCKQRDLGAKQSS